MKIRRVRNRIIELMQEKERKLGRRLRQREIARFVETADHTITSWVKNDVTRFDSRLLEKLCEFFECEVGDLLYLEWVEEDEPAADDSKHEGDA
jgi:DNA-binding Xre family transcriptional regulator